MFYLLLPDVLLFWCYIFVFGGFAFSNGMKHLFFMVLVVGCGFGPRRRLPRSWEIIINMIFWRVRMIWTWWRTCFIFILNETVYRELLFSQDLLEPSTADWTILKAPPAAIDGFFSGFNISANLLYCFLIKLVSTSGLSVAARMSHSVGFVGSEVIIDAGQIWIKFFSRFQDFDGHVNILNPEVVFWGVSCLLPCQSYKICHVE